MPNNEIILTGFEEVNRILNNFRGPNLRRAMSRAQRAALRPVLRESKRFAPVGETGNLRRSMKLRAGRRRRGRILHRVTTSSKDVQNQSGVYYGGFVHWGTTSPDGVKQLENPWLEEAADNVRNEIEGIMASTLRRELENR